MNRSITDVYSTLATDQGKVLYDYMLGLYDFLERLNQRYPTIETGYPNEVPYCILMRSIASVLSLHHICGV